MIVRLVDRLAEAGITDVVLALGFRPEPFADAFGDGITVRCGCTMPWNLSRSTPVGAIAFAARWAGIDDTFVVANGDIITDLDVSFLIDEHHRLGAHATIHLTPSTTPRHSGVVEMGEQGVVHRFVEKPQPGETDSN